MILVLLLFVQVVYIQMIAVDDTLKPGATGHDVVQATVDKIRRSGIFTNDWMFLHNLAYVETRDGTRNMNNDGGIWRVREFIFNNTKIDIPPKTDKKIQDVFGINWKTVRWSELNKPLYSALAVKINLLITAEDIPIDIAGQAKMYANFWTEGLAESNALDKFKNVVKEMQKEGYTYMQADIIFLLDASGSINFNKKRQEKVDNFNILLKFLVEQIDRLPIGKNKVRVGVIVFHKNITTKISLRNFMNKTALKDEIAKIKYPNNQATTSTDKALKKMLVTFKLYGRKNGVAHLGVLIADGASNDYNKTSNAARRVRRAGVSMIAIGVGQETNIKELAQIGTSLDHVHNIDNYNQLEQLSWQMKWDISKIVSRTSDPRCKNERRLIGITNSRSTAYYAVTIPKQGGTLYLSATKPGQVVAYASYTIRNPNSAIYDFKIVSNNKGTKIPAKKTNNCTKIYIGIRGRDGKNVNFKLIITSGDNMPKTPGVVRVGKSCARVSTSGWKVFVQGAISVLFMTLIV